jgi:hypothetical protein
MKLMATSLSIGMLLLPSQAQLQEPRKVIHLAEVTCKTFVEEMKQEQDIILDDRFHETNHIGCHHSLLVNRHFAGTS